MLSEPNLWAEDHDSACKKALATMHQARRAMRNAAQSIPALARELNRAADAMDGLIEAQSQDPTTFRRHRALTAAQLPALIEILASPDAVASNAAISQDLSVCLSAVQNIANAASNRQDADLALTASVLSGQMAPAADAPATAGWFGRIKGAMPAVNVPTFDATARAAGAANVLALAASGAASKTLSAVTTPIAARLSAAERFLDTSIRESLKATGIFAIIFPPVIPIAMALAIAEAGDEWNANVQRAYDDAERAEAERDQERQLAMTQAISAFRNGTAPVRMDTPYVELVLYPNGAIEGLVLAGACAGKRFDAPSQPTLERLERTAPDEDTARAIALWRKKNA